MKWPLRLWLAYDAGCARRTGGAVVPHSNGRDDVLPYSGGGRQYHRRIFAPTARIEVETTRYGKKTTYHFDEGYGEEMTWQEDD